jgi:hypothetical protein
MIPRPAKRRIRGRADPRPGELRIGGPSLAKPYLSAAALQAVTDAGRCARGERTGMDCFCPLDAVGGGKRACPELGCPFWEPGGAVLRGRCAFERLDLAGRPQLAAELLQIRDRLSAVSTEDDRRDWARYHRLLNESTDE